MYITRRNLKKYLLALVLLFLVTTIFIAKKGIVKTPSVICPGTLSLSPSGEMLAFVTMEINDCNIDSTIQIMNIDGENLQQITITPGFVDDSLTWSSDSKEIAFTILGNESKTIHIHTADVQSLKYKEVTTSDGKDLSAKWASDGNTICFVRRARRKDNLPKEWSYPSNLWLINIDSNQEEQLTATGEVYPLSWDWAQDGKKAFYLVTKGDLTEVWSVNIQTGKEEKLYSLKGWEDGVPSISCSPSGGNILFFWLSLDLANDGLWLLKADGSDKKKISSKKCTLMPTWITDNRILTVDIDGGMWNFDLEKNQYKRLGLEATSRQPVWGAKTKKVFFVKEGIKIWAMDEGGSNSQQIYPEISCP